MGAVRSGSLVSLVLVFEKLFRGVSQMKFKLFSFIALILGIKARLAYAEDSGLTGDTELTKTKNDLIVELVQRELISQAVLAPTIMDVSRFAKKGAQSIAFPKAGSFTVENRASGVQATKRVLTFDNDKLSLNFRATVSWLIDTMDEVESIVDVEGEYAIRAARAHAVYVENAIITEMTSAGYASGAAAGDISDAAILSMRKTLLNHKANRNGLRLAISADQEAVMLGIEKFVSAFQYGKSNIPDGAIGQVYGVPVFISTEIGATHFFMYDAEAMAIGFQRGPALDERKAPEYGAGSMLKTLDQKFGVKALETAQQSMSAGISALIVKDDN